MKTNKVVLLNRQSPAILAIATVLSVAIGIAVSSIWFLTQNQTYWAVAEPAEIGENLEELKLMRVTADFKSTQVSYLATDRLPTGYLSEPLQAGQLIPLQSISTTAVGSYSAVVVPVKSSLSVKTVAGTTVQVWVASRFGSDFAPATLLIDKAVMIGRVGSESVFKSENLEVELQIPSEAVMAMLDAVATDSAIYLVPSS